MNGGYVHIDFLVPTRVYAVRWPCLFFYTFASGDAHNVRRSNFAYGQAMRFHNYQRVRSNVSTFQVNVEWSRTLELDFELAVCAIDNRILRRTTAKLVSPDGMR